MNLLATAGTANLNNVFRFDDNTYVLNLRATELASGTRTLDFTVSGDPVTHSVTFAIT